MATRSRPRNGVCASRGFTIMEVLVSIFVLASTLAIYTTASMTTRVTRHAKYQDAALRIAESEIENLRSLSFGSLPASGPIVSTELDALPGGTGTRTITEYNTETKQANVNISWQEANMPRSIELDTLITETGGL